MLFVLGMLSVMLKFAGVVHFAWWIVLMPFYPIAAGILTLLVCGILARIRE